MDSQNKQDQTQTTLSEAETAEVLTDIGSLIFEASLGRLLLTLNEEQLSELGDYLEENDEPEKLAEYLVEHYPTFQQMIEEEATALEEKAKALNS